MKKGIWVSIIAGVAAVAAAGVAVAAFIKRKSEALSDHLDYDPEEYFEAEEDGAEETEAETAPAECCCECEDEEGSADCEGCVFAEEPGEPASEDEEKEETDAE